METKTSWVYSAAAVVALYAAAILIFVFLVADAGVAEDARSPAGCPNPDVAPARLRAPPNAAAPAPRWM